MKAKFQTLLLRINTKKSNSYHDQVDCSSTCTITPTLAHYIPPSDIDTVVEPLEEHRPSPVPSRLTFLAIWDPESQRYTLPFIPQEPLGWHEDEGFFDTCNLLGHPECEPYLHSRFSTSTTSTSNYIEVSEPQTPQALMHVNPPVAQPAPGHPEISRPFLLLPSPPREDHSSVSLVSTLTRRPLTNPLTRSHFSGYGRKTPSTSSPTSCPSSPSLSPLGFLKRKVTQSQETEDAWVHIDVESVIRERVIHI
ncbi:uncharacterized protein BT62DRAFT_993781 [Guyanagaster necrorhizus]|uniref:Uncharacterized protein n=1 Tax=Guyanagaster necrorhizus TaxID=856835 RepID=A0A9P7VUN1_9AGAR|nr:uncharacterized protein BT62DRAFT_993781 [Guyanagaster necrorhizus MCA 3950]KAG7446892.1 hypothetical protein BT62DRAFT_993781 [Guyanagaster necrorhizus MCA 3950]